MGILGVEGALVARRIAQVPLANGVGRGRSGRRSCVSIIHRCRLLWVGGVGRRLLLRVARRRRRGGHGWEEEEARGRRREGKHGGRGTRRILQGRSRGQPRGPPHMWSHGRASTISLIRIANPSMYASMRLCAIMRNDEPTRETMHLCLTLKICSHGRSLLKAGMRKGLFTNLWNPRTSARIVEVLPTWQPINHGPSMHREGVSFGSKASKRVVRDWRNAEMRG